MEFVELRSLYKLSLAVMITYLFRDFFSYKEPLSVGKSGRVGLDMYTLQRITEAKPAGTLLT